MKHPHLPQYFAIKRDENNPLWEEYIDWINQIKPLNLVTWEYIGIDKDGRQGSDVFDNFRPNPVTLITLSEWKQAIDKTEDMKETEPEFDPGKEWEFCVDIDVYHSNEYCEYICFDSKRNYHVLWHKERRDYFGVLDVRNIEPFHAGMLEIGEYMEVTEIGVYEKHLIRKINIGVFFDMETCEIISEFNLTGKRVKVNITTEEI